MHVNSLVGAWRDSNRLEKGGCGVCAPMRVAGGGVCWTRSAEEGGGQKRRPSVRRPSVRPCDDVVGLLIRIPDVPPQLLSATMRDLLATMEGFATTSWAAIALGSPGAGEGA